ncbi:phenylacetate--CoA ligase family protein [Lentisalinibacter sediminis]|uniref:phenylacetate--CoA ligase family protein n=1 Tax=Lentisalinibacter sediminis TaxID=2992237 RepID=UPI00386DE53C
MIYDKGTETRPVEEQFALDRKTYRRQVAYLFEHSTFYQQKLREAGFDDAGAVGELDEIAQLPFTEKDELRATQADAPPFGEHLAALPEKLMRVFSTSGTTGVPCYLGLTRNDVDVYATNVARGYTAAGFSAGQRIAVGFNAGPFVAGAVYYGFDKIGCTVIPVGTGNTERLVTAIRNLKATGVSCTPSYGLYLIDWCQENGIDTRSLGLTNMITAGEPGGGDPLVRGRIEEAFGCKVRESMGIGDISLSAWAEDDDGNGMHFMARGYVHVELIDPASGEPIPWEDGAEGELVYTALQREAMPLLRFRSRDHVVVNMQDNPTGRTGPRIRCVGRTDDMLIVRGVNLFPSAIRSLLQDFAPDVGGLLQVRPRERGVLQSPPLPVVVELGEGMSSAPEGLADRIRQEIRSRLLVTTEVELVPYGTLPRETYKSKLIDYSDADKKEAASG